MSRRLLCTTGSTIAQGRDESVTRSAENVTRFAGRGVRGVQAREMLPGVGTCVMSRAPRRRVERRSMHADTTSTADPASWDVRAVIDGVSLSGFRSAQVRALLAYLAVDSGRPHRRETLASLLWGEYPEHDARRSLSQALTNLRGRAGAPLLRPANRHLLARAASGHYRAERRAGGSGRTWFGSTCTPLTSAGCRRPATHPGAARVRRF